IIVKIDGIPKLRKFLCSRARAAPKRIEPRIEKFPVTRLQRKVIHLEAVLRMLRAHARIEKRPLVIIHVPGICRPLIQMSRKLQHVVAAATLFGGNAEIISELARIGEPPLSIARAARGETALLRNFIPKVFCDFMVKRLARKFIAASRADYFRDVRVDVEPFELIAMTSQWIEKIRLFKAAPEKEILASPGNRGQIEERFIHPAIFRLQDALHMSVTDSRCPVGNPLRHPLCDLQRLLVVAVRVHIQIARHDFVQSVEWRPHAAAFTQAIEKALREGAEITIRGLRLALR